MPIWAQGHRIRHRRCRRQCLRCRHRRHRCAADRRRRQQRPQWWWCTSGRRSTSRPSFRTGTARASIMRPSLPTARMSGCCERCASGVRAAKRWLQLSCTIDGASRRPRWPFPECLLTAAPGELPAAYECSRLASRTASRTDGLPAPLVTGAEGSLTRKSRVQSARVSASTSSTRAPNSLLAGQARR